MPGPSILYNAENYGDYLKWDMEPLKQRVFRTCGAARSAASNFTERV